MGRREKRKADRDKGKRSEELSTDSTNNEVSFRSEKGGAAPRGDMEQGGKTRKPAGGKKFWVC